MKERLRRFHSQEMRDAYLAGGFRERYAIDNGNKGIRWIDGHKCFRFTYSKNDEYQDANGATWDTVEKRWRS